MEGPLEEFLEVANPVKVEAKAKARAQKVKNPKLPAPPIPSQEHPTRTATTTIHMPQPIDGDMAMGIHRDMCNHITCSREAIDKEGDSFKDEEGAGLERREY